MKLQPILLFLGIILFEFIALLFIKKSQVNPQRVFLTMSIAIVCYAAVAICLYNLIKYNESVYVSNSIWNIASTMYGLFIGLVLFQEKVTPSQWFGLILGSIGIVFILQIVSFDSEK